MIKHFLYITVIVYLLFQMNCNSKGYKGIIKGLQDTVNLERLENGSLMASINSIQTKSKKDRNEFLKLQFEDSLLMSDLQNEVRRYKGEINNNTVIVYKDVVKYDSVVINKITLDTIPGDSIFVDKRYEWTIKNKWVDIKGNTFNDSTTFTSSFHSEYTIFVNNKKGYVEITNHNPYVSNANMRVLMDKPKNKRFGLGISLGYGINFTGKPTPYIGIGINYNLLKF